MRFQADQAVDDMDPRLLERSRPADVGSLVTSRLQLDKGRYLLAPFSCAYQRSYDRAVTRCPIKSLFDC